MISRDESFEWIFNRIIEINDEYKPQWRDWNLAVLGLGLGKEVGEVQDVISIWLGGGTKDKPSPDKYQAVMEVVDVFVYGIMFIETINTDYAEFLEIFKHKLEIIEQRFIAKRKKAVDALADVLTQETLDDIDRAKV